MVSSYQAWTEWKISSKGFNILDLLRAFWNIWNTLQIYTLLCTKFWRRSGVLIRNFEHISYLALVFLLLILSREMPIKNFHVLANVQVPKYSLCILLKIVTTRIRLPIFNWFFVYIFQNIYDLLWSIFYFNSVDIRCCFNLHSTTMQRQTDIETTSRVYREGD